jgi:leader peptidase (prepilin peptidase)/N-methyltransferase
MNSYYLICFYVLADVIGLCVGSFLNVVIYRIPENMSLAKPNSHCPKCKYELRWYDNIPIISYIILGGKCRNCRVHIPIRYTAVELLNMALWLLSAFLFAQKSIPLAVIYALVSSVFICIFFIDLEHQLIFDRFQIILLVLGIISIFFDKDFGWISHLIGGAAGFLIFYLISWGFESLSGKEGLGGGDVKLAGVAGLLLGWERLLLSMLVATIPAAIIMLILSRGKEGEERQFPFAPFLVVGFGVSMFFGAEIIDVYLSLLGF